MKQKVIREIVRVDGNHQLHINVPLDMGDEFEVILMPLRPKSEFESLSDDERFNLAAYSAVVDDDPEEDALWERYTHA